VHIIVRRIRHSVRLIAGERNLMPDLAIEGACADRAGHEDGGKGRIAQRPQAGFGLCHGQVLR
jgi:hypothetical protein